MTMRLASALLPACLACAFCHDVDGRYDFESGSVGTDGSPDLGAVSRQDLPVQWEEPEQRLDLPQLSDCEALDILFVVDNSPSMSGDQEKLLSATPGFLELLADLGIGWDLHVGVVTTDNDYDANPVGCRSLGALVQAKWSAGGLVACTPYSSGDSYMTQEDVESSFGCALLVGEGGSGQEQVAGAMIDALKPPLSEAEGDPWGYRGDDCNIRFRRDAALLVVLLTDEDDLSSSNTPAWWAEALLHLQPEELLVVGFVPLEHDCGDGSTAPHLREFLNGVPSYTASICAEDFSWELQAATEELVAQCGPVVPEP